MLTRHRPTKSLEPVGNGRSRQMAVKYRTRLTDWSHSHAPLRPTAARGFIFENFDFSGAFHCKGYDTFGPFKIIGGIAKKHPDEKDLANACVFFENILKN